MHRACARAVRSRSSHRLAPSTPEARDAARGCSTSPDEFKEPLLVVCWVWILFFLIEEGLALAQRSKDSPSNHGGQSPNQNDCGTWVRNINGGVFTSPNYPNTYPPNKECVYILEGKAKSFSI
ncbi:hypothetical protein PAMP_000909 [Pampus punctatissimus]